jgi:hypothetical protein
MLARREVQILPSYLTKLLNALEVTTVKEKGKNEPKGSAPKRIKTQMRPDKSIRFFSICFSR